MKSLLVKYARIDLGWRAAPHALTFECERCVECGGYVLRACRRGGIILASREARLRGDQPVRVRECVHDPPSSREPEPDATAGCAASRCSTAHRRSNNRFDLPSLHWGHALER